MTTTKHHVPGSGVMGRLLVAAMIPAMFATGLAGCTDDVSPKAQPPKDIWPVPPPKEVPSYLKGTILELAESQNKEPYRAPATGLSWDC